jgi:tetratricopeptide (TPR) repeat protein
LEPFAIKCDHCRWRVAVASDTDAGFPASAPSVAGADSAAGVSVGREYERGMELLEAEDFQSAVAHFNRAIVVAPVQRLGELYSLRGYCYLKQSDFHRAEKDCTDAIALNCCDPQTYAWRAASRGEQLNWPGAFDDLDTAQSIAGDQRDTYLDLMASYAAIAGDYYRQQIESGSESADLMFERGWVHLRMGKYENAFNEFQSAIKLQRDHPWAFTGLAKLWIEGRINASFFSISNGAGGGLPTEFPASDFDVVRWCDRGVKGDVLCRRAALEMRSRLYLDQGQLDQAKADLATLLNLAGDDPDARLACCQLWFEMDQAMPAVTELNKILHDHPENPKALLLRARCFATVKNYSLAIDDFRRYLSAHPDDHAASVELGNVFLATHQINEAAKLFESAINAVGNNFESYHGLSRVFLKRNQLDEALTQCLKAIRIDNRCAEVFATEAEIYLRLGDDTRAIDSYSRAARIASSDASKGTYLYLRGAAYYSLNKFSEALCDFQLSCLLRPNHAGALVWKAAACARKEYWTQAIVCLNRAIEIRPDAAQQYQQLGQPLAQKAIKHFDKKLSDNANDANAYRDRAMANQFIGMYASSIEDLTMALDLASGSVSLLIQRGRVYAATGDHRSAIKDFTRALKIDRRNHLARFYRAQSRVQCGHLDRAQRDIQKAIRINSCRPAYHQLLADVFLESGRLDQVVLSLDRSILLDSTDVAAFQLRGEIQSRLKNYFAAVSDFTRALELEPVKTELLVARAQALAKAEKHAAAIEDFERALSRNSLLVKAYCGRALSLASIERQEYATIWLTKSFHRFKKPRDLAELLFARGKIFYQMVLYGAATIDFTAVAKIMRNDPKVVAAAKYARAIARVHAGQRDLAEKDFHAVLEIDPQHDPSRLALHWMSRRDEVPLPPFLVKPVHNRRPTRPPVVRSQVVLTTRPRDWRAELPYDTWVLRTLEKKEYGPIQREVLDRWVQEGRIDFGMKLLRADWSKWQRVEKIFKELLPAKVNGAAVPAPVFPMVRQHKAKTKAGCDANPSE